MSVRSLNKVMLIGNLTRDPELRYTPNGVAVCTFGMATNRSWTTEAGERKEDAEFHRIVAWSKLAELCSQLLTKGKKVFVEGRLQTRSWQGQDGNQRQTTEIVIEDMIILDSRRALEGGEAGTQETRPPVQQMSQPPAPAQTSQVSTASETDAAVKPKPESTPEVAATQNESVDVSDIPF